MATELTWLGHGSWMIVTGGCTLLLDPFLDESPTAPLKSADVRADYILVSHGHFDHVADVVPIAKRTGAQVISVFEIAQWLAQRHQVANTLAMNLGGSVSLPFGRIKMTAAWHSSQLPDGTYGGTPCGFLLHLADGVVYFACDTALFGDMRLIASQQVNLAVLPIGDLFTMGPDDAVEAIKLIEPKKVTPAHYNTWPPIKQDPYAWAKKVAAVTNAEAIIVEPGGKIML